MTTQPDSEANDLDNTPDGDLRSAAARRELDRIAKATRQMDLALGTSPLSGIAKMTAAGDSIRKLTATSDAIRKMTAPTDALHKILGPSRVMDQFDGSLLPVPAPPTIRRANDDLTKSIAELSQRRARAEAERVAREGEVVTTLKVVANAMDTLVVNSQLQLQKADDAALQNQRIIRLTKAVLVLTALAILVAILALL